MVIGTSLATYESLLIALAAILLDFVLGVLISIKKGTFDVGLLPKCVATSVFPYLGGLVVLAFLSSFSDLMQYLYMLFLGLVTLKYSKEALVDKIKELFVK